MVDLNNLSGLVSNQLNDQVKKVEDAKAARERLAPEVKDEVLDAFDAHYREQSALELKHRKLFKDKYGVFVIIMYFPEKSTNEKFNWRNTGTEKKPNYRWYGPTIPLIASRECTVFNPSPFTTYGFSSVIRCKIKEDYLLIGNVNHQKVFGTWKEGKLVKKAYAVSETLFEKKVGKLEDHKFEYNTVYTINIVEGIHKLKAVVK